jgi:hypothetical protein
MSDMITQILKFHACHDGPDQNIALSLLKQFKDKGQLVGESPIDIEKAQRKGSARHYPERSSSKLRLLADDSECAWRQRHPMVPAGALAIA